MSDTTLAIVIGFLNTSIAAAVGYVLYRVIAPKGESFGPTDTARRAAAWLCAISAIISIPKLFRARSVMELAEGYTVLILTIVVFGLLAFVVGWVVGRLFLKYKSQ